MRNVMLRLLPLVVGVLLIGSVRFRYRGRGPSRTAPSSRCKVRRISGSPTNTASCIGVVIPARLAGKHILWSNRVEVSLDRLRTLPVGDPWLTAGLLKDGDPIYLVKWET